MKCTADICTPPYAHACICAHVSICAGVCLYTCTCQFMLSYIWICMLYIICMLSNVMSMHNTPYIYLSLVIIKQYLFMYMYYFLSTWTKNKRSFEWILYSFKRRYKERSFLIINFFIYLFQWILIYLEIYFTACLFISLPT